MVGRSNMYCVYGEKISLLLHAVLNVVFSHEADVLSSKLKGLKEDMFGHLLKRAVNQGDLRTCPVSAHFFHPTWIKSTLMLLYRLQYGIYEMLLPPTTLKRYCTVACFQSNSLFTCSLSHLPSQGINCGKQISVQQSLLNCPDVGMLFQSNCS